MTSRRLGGLDRLRGAALVLMLFHHFTGWFGGDPRAVIPGWPGFALTDVAAPAFTVALGASVPLLLRSRQRRGCSAPAIATIALRRYGLLVPIGVALRAALGFDLGHIGVLETLGLSALVVAIVSAATNPPVRLGVAVAVTAVAPFVERAASHRSDWASTHLLTGTFPLVAYLGLALLGAAAVPALSGGSRRGAAAALATAFVAWSSLLALHGQAPDRYPGDASFLVPGIAGTLVLYVLVSGARWEGGSFAGRVVERAGTHTFGVFIGQYGLYVALKVSGHLHDLPSAMAVSAAAAATLAFVLLAPRVPTLPWSPRTGWSRPRRPTTGTGATRPNVAAAAPALLTSRRG